jgi:hypothetical protein
MKVDYWRQLDVFNPEEMKEPVHVIGVGATGSNVIETLARMGVKHCIGYDFDTIEDHNIPNQVFRKSDWGRPKVQAMKEIVSEISEMDFMPIQSKGKLIKINGLSGIVMLFVDTWDSRRKLWESSIKNNPNIKLFVESRLSSEVFRLYAFNPCDQDSIKKWEATLFEDKPDDEMGDCRNRAISSTLKVASGMLSHILVCNHRGWPYPNHTLVSMRPFYVATDNWK